MDEQQQQNNVKLMEFRSWTLKMGKMTLFAPAQRLLSPALLQTVPICINGVLPVIKIRPKQNNVQINGVSKLDAEDTMGKMALFASAQRLLSPALSQTAHSAFMELFLL
ncbi:hypothetical protein CEXT_226741 [Caerostris extrusa]|uniref:Uncharacterized protein n=1 Tax=Caerostris extrusa TaxID=172846 RepID=A0AAV4XU74_CAEEX|nr:hypothetical protein CEXT_226741 [Caerostris extrusa]